MSHVNSHTCTFKALLQSTTPVQSPSFDVLIEIRRACLGHNVVPSISGARPSGRRQRVRSVAEQIESHNCNRHGLLWSCQQQSLQSVGGHYNIRLFKLSRLKRRRKFHEFSTLHQFQPRTSSAMLTVGSVQSTCTPVQPYRAHRFHLPPFGHPPRTPSSFRRTSALSDVLAVQQSTFPLLQTVADVVNVR